MKRWLECPNCGLGFDRADSPCQRGCPLGRWCDLACCPACGHEFAAPPRWWQWWRRVRRHSPVGQPTGAVCHLGDLQEGETTELVCVNTANEHRRHSLAVYGLVPGCELTLQQKRPAYVIRIGETELALEHAIATELLVRRRSAI
ncbi:MAG: ferrous iron transport protein A [Verrucomicrobiae bacterium]|nr:ferrous iron transport protein A [Verrucomicrobiae bacterium]